MHMYKVWYSYLHRQVDIERMSSYIIDIGTVGALPSRSSAGFIASGTLHSSCCIIDPSIFENDVGGYVTVNDARYWS